MDMEYIIKTLHMEYDWQLALPVHVQQTEQSNRLTAYAQCSNASVVLGVVILIIIIMEKTEAGLKGLCIRGIKTI